MSDIKLTAAPRTEFGSGPAGRHRRAGQVPAVVYGLSDNAESVIVDALALERILHGASGANTLITLQLEGDDTLALARQIQRHPTRGDLVHVDFIRIRRDVAVQAEIPIQLIGDAPGIREGGVLEQLVFTVTVEAMPGNIPDLLEVDVSSLALGDQLRVEDLVIPVGVAVQQEADDLVVQVTIPRGMDEEEEAGEEGEEGEGGDGEASEGGDEGADGEE